MKRKISILILILSISACSDGGNNSTVSGASTTESYAVTLTAIGLDRSADQLALAVDGLPVDGPAVSVIAD